MSKAHDAQGELIRAYGAFLMREIERKRHLYNFGFKLCTPRPRWFATLPEACAAAEDYRKQTGVFVAIEEPRRRAWAI
jgi:hypothetical protein